MSMTELLTMIGIENATKAVTALLIFISACAFLTSLVTEGLKCIKKIDSLPTKLVCYIVAIVLTTPGEATQELLKKVENATAYLKGNYDDFLYKSSTIVNVDIKLTLYIAKDASTDGVQQTAEKTIEKFMQLSSREELNCLYMDDIRYALKSDIETYKRAEISSPDGDIELDKGKVIMLGGIEVIVKNVGGA